MIVISPYSRPLRNGKRNPKNYPYWNKLVKGLKEKGHRVVQIGVQGEHKIPGVDEVKLNMKLKDLKTLLLECDTWISVDNFLPHLAEHIKKPGIVIWGRSNPTNFGYAQNNNILKDVKYLRDEQFKWWEDVEYSEDVFVKPDVILKFI